MGKRGRLDLAYGFRQKARKHHRCRKKTVGRYLERRIPVCIEPLDHVVRTDGKGGPEHPEYPGVDRNAPVPQHQDEHPEERKPQRNPRKPRQTLPEYDGRHQRRNDGRGSNEDASRGRRQRLGTFIDTDRFSRVVNNIISNSIKYRRKDVRGKISLIISEYEHSVIFEIADNGMGVDSKSLSRIFDTLYRADKARSNVSDGSGLGLAVCKQIVELHKGMIWAQTNAEKGLSIFISLPKTEGPEVKDNEKDTDN